MVSLNLSFLECVGDPATFLPGAHGCGGSSSGDAFVSTLSLDGCPITDKTLEALSTITECLRHLSLRWCDQVSSAAVCDLVRSGDLASINVTDLPFVDDVIDAAPPNCQVIATAWLPTT